MLISQIPLKQPDYIIFTDFHPCNGRTCPFYAVCQAPTKTTHRCVCVPCETEESAPLCDNNDVTHKNKCEYNYHVCLAQEEPGIKHYGGCKRESLLILFHGISSCKKWMTILLHHLFFPFSYPLFVHLALIKYMENFSLQDIPTHWLNY